jgi:diguanylate cyclase (GGDEF)-like protein
MTATRPLAPRAARSLSLPTRESSSERIGLDDVLVFEHTDRGFALVGGSGRGAGWAGIVDLLPSDEALVGRAWRRGTAERQSCPRPTQVAGPYYARHAVAVPVGQSHVVVLGSQRAIALRDSELVKVAAAAVDGIHGISADKVLADELEVVQALRALMAYKPITVRDTARHIAAVAAHALSCEVAVIRVELDGQIHVEGLDIRSMSSLTGPDADGHLATIAERSGPVVEQVVAPHPDVFGLEVASHLTLPLTGENRGALALGHAIGNARGFTSLCQRIGRAIADAADLLISQAHTREQLASERDLLARLVRTDALTGAGNRRAWDDAVKAWPSERGGSTIAHVITCDLDGLKMVNDQFGHAAGDALIRGAANLLRSCVREVDLVMRVGGDEFVVVLASADESDARRIVRRLRQAQRLWRVTEYGLTPRISIGFAPVVDGDLDAARAAADKSMYQSKRRRRAATVSALSRRRERRSA